MTTGLSYDGSIANTMSYQAQLALLAVIPVTDTNFQTVLPAAITYAENRIYRDLDLIYTISSNTNYAFTPSLRYVQIDPSVFVTIEEINVITPAGTSNPELGARVPLTATTKEFLDFTYGSSTGAGVPAWFAMRDQSTFYVGPWPDQAYTIELVGTIRPDSLSAGNLTTFISLNLPDLFLMASMVYISGYQRNWSGSASNDPEMPVNYESQYKTLLAAAGVEEARKKFQASGWTSMSPAPVAQPRQ